ncbi:MAG: hypothetical protein Q9227_007831 [Pyrenula ochraceoflavens]
MAYRPIVMPGAFIEPSESSPGSLSSSYTSTSGFQSPRSSSRPKASRAKRIKLDKPSDSDPLYSPAPLANEKYYLAGGLDTPGVLRESYFEGNDIYERKYRIGRNLSPNQIQKEQPLQANAWGSAMLEMVGGIINFCWTKTFKGFQAGGGKGYDLGGQWVKVPPKEDVHHSEYDIPDDHFIHDYMSNPTEYQAMELSTPTKYKPRTQAEIDWLDSQRRSHNNSPFQTPPNRTRASFAGRPLLTQTRRPSASDTGSQTYLNTGGSASYASPRGSLRGLERTPPRSKSHPSIRPSSATKASLNTPSPEVAKFEKTIKKRERKQNASVRRMNQKLEDLIRGGTEALGAKIEIEDVNMEDEGYDS